MLSAEYMTTYFEILLTKERNSVEEIKKTMCFLSDYTVIETAPKLAKQLSLDQH